MQKQIVVQTLDDQGRYLSLEELKTILDYWPEHDRNRLIIEIGAFVGLRLKDILGDKNKSNYWIGGLKVPEFSITEGFSKDYKELKYLVSKPNNNKERIKWKIKTRAVPDWLAFKLTLYFNHNRHTMLDGLFFGKLKPKSFRSAFETMRNNIYKQGNKWAKEVIQRIIMRNGNIRTDYRCSFHAARAFYISGFYSACDKDLVMTQKNIGHSNPQTTAKYIRFHNLKEKDREIANTKFNLPNQPGLFISKEQKKLKDFWETENKADSRDLIVVNGFVYSRCNRCSNLFYLGKNAIKRKFCLNCGRKRRKDYVS